MGNYHLLFTKKVLASVKFLEALAYLKSINFQEATKKDIM